MILPSSLVISLGWGLIDLPLRAAFSPTHPPTGTPRRAMSPGEGLPILFISLQGSGQGRPLLRASNEHLLSVRVLRARRAPGRSLPILLRPRVARAQKIISLHPFPLPSLWPFTATWALGDVARRPYLIVFLRTSQPCRLNYPFDSFSDLQNILCSPTAYPGSFYATTT